MDTLAFGYILPTTGRIRDFNPLETCAARRTHEKKLSWEFLPQGELLFLKICFTLKQYKKLSAEFTP